MQIIKDRKSIKTRECVGILINVNAIYCKTQNVFVNISKQSTVRMFFAEE